MRSIVVIKILPANYVFIITFFFRRETYTSLSYTHAHTCIITTKYSRRVLFHIQLNITIYLRKRSPSHMHFQCVYTHASVDLSSFIMNNTIALTIMKKLYIIYTRRYLFYFCRKVECVRFKGTQMPNTG